MGVSDRRPPPLPAPTETSSDNFGNTTSDDLATDISRRTDRTSYSIPEDGSPVVISTKRKGRGDGEGGRGDQSQTSLLIEYFEAGKTGGKPRSRPSVRVRVTPSSKKDREGSDHIQITETGKTRKPSYTRRISLGSKQEERVPLPAGTEASGYSADSNESGGHPIDVEVLQNTSDLSQLSSLPGTGVSPYQPNFAEPSNVSSMPPDSLLEEVRIHTPPRSPLFEEPATTSTLKGPEEKGSLSRLREREITHRVMERIAQREASGKLSPPARRTSSREYVVEDRPSRKRTSSDSRRTEESYAAESNLSNLNPSEISRRSDRSGRSGASNVSINNPKLLQTVEDAIKRLILPELNAVKEEQKLQRNRSRFEHEVPESISSIRSEGVERRMSKSSSAPDVKGSKPKVLVSGEEEDLHPKKLRKERRSSKGSSRQASSETVVKDEDRVRRKSSRDHNSRSTNAAKEAALALGAGALTAAALKHHDSISSIDSSGHRRRRKRRSKSRSRTASISESVEERSGKKETIPPLPMQSEVQSDLTRDSILSANTERPASASSRGMSTPTKEYEIRQVNSGSPRHVPLEESPTTPTRTPERTPTRTPTSLRNQLGTHHANISAADISAPGTSTERDFSENLTPAAAAGIAGFGAPAVMSRLHDVSSLHESMSANTLENYTPQRPLSPIQSVSSYRDSTVGPAQHSRVQSIKSEASLRSPKKHGVHRPGSAQSADSQASSQSAEFYHAKNRPAGFSLEPGYEIMADDDDYEPETPTGEHFEATPRAADVDDFFEQGHEDNERYRHEYEEEEEAEEQRDSADYSQNSPDYNRHSHTRDSSNGTFDKVLAGQGLRNVHNNLEYVRTPIAVESAVASLHDPSSISVHSSQASLQKMMPSSQVESELSQVSQDDPKVELYETRSQDNSSKERWGVLRNKAQALHDEKHQPQQTLRSPEQSPAVSDDHPVSMKASAMPVPGDDMPVIGHGLDDEELDTNPSIIRGPMAGAHYGDRSHWPYDPTPPRSTQNNARQSFDDLDDDAGHHAELGAGIGGAAVGAAVGLGLAHAHSASKDLDTGAAYQQPGVEDEYGAGGERDYSPAQGMFTGRNLHSATPLKDEGYISSAQQGAYTPEPYPDLDDPFRSKREAKHLSGMSHGMESPLFDAATGKGIDRIQSKDVVALMDHLTVRDAQRNARDTEILVTLVRSAAEMRNSFEEMKEFIEAQKKELKGHTHNEAEMVVQKVVGGPRPQPSSSPRVAQRLGTSEDGDDSQGKRKNMFRRALKGLSMRSTNDLARVEDMLTQLLNEVEGLKETQVNMTREQTRTASLNSNDFLRQSQDPGYEPDGQAGTSSTPNQSGYFSNPSSRQLSGGMQRMHSGYDGRRGSGQRVSTVLEEGDEEEEYHGDAQYPDEDRMTTPTQEAQVQRLNSLPMETPPQQNTSAFRTSQGADQTPRTYRSSRHRSQNSSLFGNFANKVSRWSKTTTSTEPRMSQDRPIQRPDSEASRSGDDLNQYEGQYHLQDDDRIRSNGSLARDQYNQAAMSAEQSRSPSPLIPDNEIDDPRYQAHRNSLNLQHPQPRPGPTHRHQSHLESEAQNYYESLLDDGADPDQWGSNPSLALNRNINRISTSTGGGLSPVYSDNVSVHSASEQAMQQPSQSQNPPPRPPKIRDDGPLVPGESPQQSRGHHRENSAPYLATRLEPIEEARYSLETERFSRGNLTPSPNLAAPPTAMQNVQRRITGPRPMGSKSPSTHTGQAQPQRGSPAGSRENVEIRRKPVSVRSAASDSTLQSYRSSLDEDNEMF